MASPRRSKGKVAKPVETSEKTYEDFRAAALALLPKSPSWSEYLIERGILQHWAEKASEQDIASWIEKLEANQQARAFALVAIVREDLAPSLLKRAAAKHDPKDEHNHFTSLLGLIPAWWKYGKAKQAEAGFKLVADVMMKNGTKGNTAPHRLFSLAALGGQWATAAKIAKTCFEDSDGRGDIAVPGIVAAYVAGEKKLFAAMMKRWTAAARQRSSQLSLALLRVLLERGEPETYFDLMFAWPEVIDIFARASYALAQIEVKDRNAAIAIAERLLADKTETYMYDRALAILARHAPAKATAWLKKTKNDSIRYAAAAGQDVRAQLKTADLHDVGAVGWFTGDRELAIEALVHAYSKLTNEVNTWMLTQLVALGAREQVDAILEKRLAAIGKLATKERAMPCMDLAHAAVQCGRPDIAFAACKLPSPTFRGITPGDVVRGAVEVGDFTSAVAALALIPDKEPNTPVRAATLGMELADAAFVNGPYALPPAAIDGTTMRALIALKARGAIELALALAPAAIPEDVRVEVDAFLEGRAFAPR